MDLFMPEMDGLEATREIMYVVPTPIIVVSGSAGEREADLALKSISSGALTAIRKPPGPRDPGYRDEVRELLNTVRAMADVQVIHRWKSEATRPAAQPVQPLPSGYAAGSPRIV